MRVRVFLLGCLLSAAIAAGSSAAISPYSFMPSMSDLSSFGFPASMLTPQAYLPSASPESMIGLTASLLPDSTSQAAFNGLMPGISGSMSGFPMMAGISSFTSPMGLASQIPTMSSAMSPFSLPGLQLPSTGDTPGATPTSVNNYTEASNGRTITVALGDTIHVQLPSRVDQGYIWNLSVTGGLNASNVRMYPPEQVSSNILAGQIAIQSLQEWDIKAIGRGTQYVTAICKRPWAEGPEDRTYKLTVIVV